MEVGSSSWGSETHPAERAMTAAGRARTGVEYRARELTEQGKTGFGEPESQAAQARIREFEWRVAALEEEREISKKCPSSGKRRSKVQLYRQARTTVFSRATVSVLCGSRSGYHAGLRRRPNARQMANQALGEQIADYLRVSRECMAVHGSTTNYGPSAVSVR